MRLLMIDNYDSFTYNLVQYLGELGAEVEVFRNDVASPEELLAGCCTSPATSPMTAASSRSRISTATGSASVRTCWRPISPEDAPTWPA